MTANEAREKAHAVNTAEHNSQYSKIQEQIKLVVEKGEYAFTSEGFKFDNSNLDRDGFSIRISWE